ncbi:MAG: chemotaxis protein CheW [Opitutales bacterium]|nr:chemotaxis protein CheW [Opitutales bacterium]
MSSFKTSVRCWNDIGIWGDSTCPRLVSAIHCANCGIYSDAGRELFEREIPKDYFKTWIDEIENSADFIGHTGESFFVFKCGENLFALPMKVVSEVSSMRMIHKIPYRRGGTIVGLVNINGELVPATDLLSLFSLPTKLENPKSIVVCSFGLNRFAFAVDSVRGISVADENSIADADISDAWYVEKKFTLNGEKIILINFEILTGAVLKKGL